MPTLPQTYILRILHLSDLHAGKPGCEHDWRRRRVLGQDWEDNLDVIRDSGRDIEIVCFTGDAANDGQYPKSHFQQDSTLDLYRLSRYRMHLR